MQPAIRYRRQRRPASRDITAHQTGQREPLFFGQPMPAPFFQPMVQRKCAACQNEEKVQRVPDKKEAEKLQRATDKKEEEKLHKKESGHTTSGHTHTTAHYIGAINGKGKPLSNGQQSFFGNRMGANFSQVRIHTGPEAAASAKAINAQAYAYGNHIVFNEGKYQPEASEGQHLLAHELAHVVQQGGAATQLQRQVGPAPPAPAAPAPAAPVPHFRDCVRSVTGSDDADAVLDAALRQARDFVNTAIDLLANPPAPGSVYETALALHFGSPIGAGARAALRRVYRRILGTLAQRNIICNSARICNPGDQGFWTSSDDLVHICPPYWRLGPVCQSIVLIHEGAHDSEIDHVDDPATPGVEHTPDRGSASYPMPRTESRRRVSRSLRAHSPDAFGFFAAHVHRGRDTTGFCDNP